LIIEKGRAPSSEEFCIDVQFENDKKNISQFYFQDGLNVLECKALICEEFKVNIHQYSLWDIDKIYGDPCVQVKNEKGSWGKNQIKNGERLIL
jgi:hypothetical protein